MICVFSCGISLSGIAQGDASSSTSFGQAKSSSSDFVSGVTNGPWGNSSGSNPKYAPPPGGDYGNGNGAITPIGSGVSVLVGLSLIYMFYVVSKNRKKFEL